MIVQEKRCYKCKKMVPIEKFSFNKSRKDGHDTVCKDCRNAMWHRWFSENAETRRARQRKTERRRTWTYGSEKAKQWRESNREALRDAKRKSDKKRRSTPDGKLNHSMSRGIWKSVRTGKGGMHWEALVGYTLSDLMKSLERQFLPGMTLENYGKWHIDHIVPVSAFNFTSPDHIDFQKCWALDNLRPLWAAENMRKHNKIDVPYQPALLISAARI